MIPESPEPATIHKRFCCALAQVALEGAGKVHLDYRVETEAMDVDTWKPRRSANEVNPPHAQSSDPNKRLQQGILGAALGAAGMEAVTVHVESFSLWLDLYFVPEPRGVPAPGLLGRMTRSPSILAFHHETPDAGELRDAMCKSLNLWTNQDRDAKGAGKKRPKLVGTWVISGAHTPEMRKTLGFEPKEMWPEACLFTAPMLGIAAIAVGELAETRETLLLRLLGTGDVLEKALAEQAELPPDALERRATQAALLAAVPPKGEAVPIEARVKDPVLRACRQTYRRWAAR